ncbi:MAG TPA: nucleoside phosphorylase [Aggregatilineales bacterium]|nr:nucleoside phosphorylase [Aggregatilineales bacterium]
MNVPDNYPILDFDPDPRAVISPRDVMGEAPADMPEHCVICFFSEVIARVVEEHQPCVVKHIRSEMMQHPVYAVEANGMRFAFFHPGIGAPLAVALLEEVIALGCRKFIACGGAGVLNREVAVGHVLVPTVAVREEGTSYHYLPPGREVEASPAGVGAITATLEAHGVDYLLGKTWTTDAIYRETPGKIARRREESCLTVEMEAASFFACAQFRDVIFAQILYGGDDVSGSAWDDRQWVSRTSIRERLFWLAAEACTRL